VFVERLLAVLPVFPFDLVTARLHASLRADLAAKGASVGSHDLLIGATAIALGFAWPRATGAASGRSRAWRSSPCEDRWHGDARGRRTGAAGPNPMRGGPWWPSAEPTFLRMCP
jgi:hypothetical protein